MVRVNRRGQLVLVAAAVVALALVPVVAAYLQLGYAPGSGTAAEPRPGADAERLLSRAVARAPVLADYDWTNRADAVAAVRGALAPRLDALRTARLTGGTAAVVAYAPGVADSWAAARCPSGPNRQFGACRADGGVVVQERDGRTHLVAVAVAVRVVSDGRTATLTLVVER
ncbi:DUF7261 family protein [Salarchaeum japonicum]|uniref:DUF7261 family protein n=1 Tax=Salarchaeum japonicum TaxID=555573 RepID=UPI001D0BC555|nr:hypothetical protein [Salarchaeum japonicum]